jgi:hypothetical protein
MYTSLNKDKNEMLFVALQFSLQSSHSGSSQYYHTGKNDPSSFCSGCHGSTLGG